MTSSRRLPLSFEIESFGAAGFNRDWTDLGAAESSSDTDRVTAMLGWVLDCYVDQPSFDDIISMAVSNLNFTNADYFRVIRAAAGQSHDGTPNTGVFFNNTSDASIFTASEHYAQFQNLVTMNTVNSASTKISINLTGDAEFCGVIGCIDINSSNSGAGGANSFSSGVNANENYFINTIAINPETNGYAKNNAGTTYFYNCNAINCPTGFRRNAGAAIAKNCLTYNNGINFQGIWTQVTNVELLTDQFIDSANNNYLLKPTAVTAIDQGTDLSSDPNYAFNDDILGRFRPTKVAWDTGFNELSVPTVVFCPVNDWTPVALNVNSGVLNKLSTLPRSYLQTYRLTGEAAPTDNTDAANLFDIDEFFATFSSSDPIDIYVKPVGKNGQIGVYI